jgi:hypothetical protein
VLAVTLGQAALSAPAMADGIQNLALSDPATGASSTMTGVLTFGAGREDSIILVAGANPATPGGQAPNPVRVQVLAPDGKTPVNGASVFFTATPAVSFSGCAGAATCALLTDASGFASSFVTPLNAATMNIKVDLAPASYKNPQFVQATLLGTSSALDVSLVPEYAWIAQGATVDVPLTARLLSNGVPQAGNVVNFLVVKGSGALSSSSATTDANGYASTTLHLSTLAGDVQVSACAAAGNQPCQTFFGTAVPASGLRLQAVAGSQQTVAAPTSFQPVIARVTDASTPPDPVIGAAVAFHSVVTEPAPASPPIAIGGIIIIRNPAPVIVSSSQGSVVSDLNGLAIFQPSTGGAIGTIQVQGTMAAGASSLSFTLQSFGTAVPATRLFRPPIAYPKGEQAP